MSASEYNRRLREAARKAQRDMQREVDRVNRENKRKVDDYNRRVDQHNRREIDRVNRANKKAVDDYNRKAEQHNQKVIADINRRLSSPSTRTVTYQPVERALVDRVHGAINFDDGREYDVFLSYARIDGEDTAKTLAAALEERGVSVWIDAVAIQPGKVDRSPTGTGCSARMVQTLHTTRRLWP